MDPSPSLPEAESVVEPMIEPVVVVVAGGSSSRMGCDKRLLRLGGETLIARAVRLARKLPWPVAVAAGTSALDPRSAFRRELAEELEADEETDLRWCADGPGLGPAAGLLGAAECAPGHPLLVLPCDQPLLSFELLSALDLSARQGTALDLAVFRDQGRWHPLLAWYSELALGRLRRRVSNGNFALHELCVELCQDRAVNTLVLGRTSLPAFDGARWSRELFNCNDQSDWARVQHWYQQSRG